MVEQYLEMRRRGELAREINPKRKPPVLIEAPTNGPQSPEDEAAWPALVPKPLETGAYRYT
jgi:hypothetical protein